MSERIVTVQGHDPVTATHQHTMGLWQKLVRAISPVGATSSQLSMRDSLVGQLREISTKYNGILPENNFLHSSNQPAHSLAEITRIVENPDTCNRAFGWDIGVGDMNRKLTESHMVMIVDLFDVLRRRNADETGKAGITSEDHTRAMSLVREIYALDQGHAVSGKKSGYLGGLLDKNPDRIGGQNSDCHMLK